MLVRNHVVASGVVGGIWYYIFRSMPEALICFLAGVLIDIDHFIDYYLNHSFTFKFKKIHDAYCELNFKKLYLLLHSFELIILIWVLGILFYPDRIWLAVAVGFSHHVIFDQVFNHAHPFTYFLTYRALRSFQIKYFFRETSSAKRRFFKK